MDLAVSPPAADPMLPAFAMVASRVDETPDVVTLTLDHPGWAGCTPGQFTMLGLPGLGEIPISVSGGADGGPLVHTVRAVGPVSRAIASLGPGEALTVRGPYGRGWPIADETGRDVRIVAGGLGLAPLRPVIDRVAARRAEYGRVQLAIGARGPGDLAFLRDLDRWRDRDIDIAVTVDHAPPGWPGRIGTVNRLLAPGAPETSAFVCGPEIMMRISAETLEQGGVDPDRIHVSLERNMQCGVGLCGHCQLGPLLLCRDGPVATWAEARGLLRIREL